MADEQSEPGGPPEAAPDWWLNQLAEQNQREEAAQVRAERVGAAWDRFNALQAEGEQTAQELESAAQEVQQTLLNAAIEWLAERWGPQQACPYCETTSWSVGTPFFVSLQSGESLSPHFAVMCDNCGNTVFINAILAGLVPEEDAEE